MEPGRRARLPQTRAAIRAAQARLNGDALLARRITWLEEQALGEGQVPSSNDVAKVLGFERIARAREQVDLDGIRERIRRRIEEEELEAASAEREPGAEYRSSGR